METLRQVSLRLICKEPLYSTRAPRVSDNSSMDFYSQMLRGLGSQAQVLKFKVPNVGYRSFTLSGEMAGFEFPRDCGSERHSAVSGKISATLPSSVWFPFHLRDVKRFFRLFSSSSLSAIRVVSYLRLLIFLLAILIPASASSSLTFRMIHSAYKLNKQGDNIQP